MKQSNEKVAIEAGEKIEIFRRRFSSVPINYQFTAQPLNTDILAGSIEIHRSRMVLSLPVESTSIKPKNTVHASMWDTFMTIYVIAGCDMEISIPQRNMEPLKRIFVWLIIILVTAIALLFMR